jgi:AAA domain
VKPRPLQRGKGTSLTIFGAPGAGKTRLIATGKRTLIIRPPSDHIDSIDFPHQAEEIIVEDWADMLEALQYVQQEGWEKHDWVWLDSISAWQDYGLDDVLEAAITRKPQRAVELAGMKVPELGPDKGEYRTNMERMASWVRVMSGLADAGKINFGMTAHMFEWYDPVREEDVWMPWIQGKNMSPKLCGYMNIVAYLMKVEREGKDPQTVLLSEAPGFFGKDQYQCFPKLKSGRRGIVSPDMEKIEQAINGARPAPKRKVKRRRSQ